MGPDPEQIDPLVGLMADIDQSIMLVPQVARIARAFYEAFVGSGFEEGPALALTMQQMAMMARDDG